MVSVVGRVVLRVREPPGEGTCRSSDVVLVTCMTIATVTVVVVPELFSFSLICVEETPDSCLKSSNASHARLCVSVSLKSETRIIILNTKFHPEQSA